jgi:hypothetical protein
MIRLLLFSIIIDLEPNTLHHLLLAHIRLFYTLDHAEPGQGVQAEQAQAEEITNLVLDKGKPRCIIPNP